MMHFASHIRLTKFKLPLPTVGRSVCSTGEFRASPSDIYTQFLEPITPGSNHKIWKQYSSGWATEGCDWLSGTVNTMRQLHWNGERGAVECHLVCSEDRQGSYSPGSVLKAIADQCHRRSTGWLTEHNYCSMESYSTS